MFYEQWKILIKLPSVFSFKRYLKAHNHDRRLKENYKQHSVTRINLLQSIWRQTVYGKWNSVFYNLSNAGEQLLMQPEGPTNLYDCFNLIGQKVHDVSVWTTSLWGRIR